METGDLETSLAQRDGAAVKDRENKFITCHQRATLFCSGEDGARCSHFSVGDTSDASLYGKNSPFSLSHDVENFHGHDKLPIFLREVRKCLVPAISLLFFMLEESAVQRNYLLRLRLRVLFP